MAGLKGQWDTRPRCLLRQAAERQLSCMQAVATMPAAAKHKLTTNGQPANWHLRMQGLSLT